MTYALRNTHGKVPMRVVARLDEPLAYLGDLLHLDGFLHSAALHDLDLRTRKTIEPIETADWPTDFTLPLATWWVDYDPDQHGEINPQLLKRGKTGKKGTDPQLWGWCATAADDEAWQVRSKLEIRKRPPLKEMGRYTDARTHNVSSGHMKAYDLAKPTVFSREVVWYALGDPDRVRHLLTAYITAIGGKRSIGSGTVREWLVEETSVDTDGVLVDGKLARRMPAGAAEGAYRMGAIRPPYWHHTRNVGSVEPC